MTTELDLIIVGAGFSGLHLPRRTPDGFALRPLAVTKLGHQPCHSRIDRI